jgi:hypothetical protein
MKRKAKAKFFYEDLELRQRYRSNFFGLIDQKQIKNTLKCPAVTELSQIVNTLAKWFSDSVSALKFKLVSTFSDDTSISGNKKYLNVILKILTAKLDYGGTFLIIIFNE